MLRRTRDMRSSDLYRLLGDSANGSRVRSAIAEFMPTFRRGLAERGRSAPIVLQDIERSLVINPSHLRNLCSWLIRGDIDEVEFHYLTNAITLSEDFGFADKSLEEYIETLASLSQRESLLTEVWRITTALGGAP